MLAEQLLPGPKVARGWQLNIRANLFNIDDAILQLKSMPAAGPLRCTIVHDGNDALLAQHNDMLTKLRLQLKAISAADYGVPSSTTITMFCY